MRLLFVCLSTMLLVAGCASKRNNEAPVSTGTRVEWFGHLCLRVTTPIGTQILIDPFRPGSTPYSLPSSMNPDVILISRETPDCTNTAISDGTPSIYRGSVAIGPNNAAGVRIVGTPIFPAVDGNAMNSLGMNLVYSWNSGGLRFCHPGVLNRGLAPSEVQQIGRVDVLFLPIDAPYGQSHAELNEIVAQLRPRVVVPIAFTSGSVNAWASSYTDVRHLPGRSFVIRPDMLPNPPNPTVLIFGD
ncbi:MAG TPA: MBL fold metallo-hydrolase [Chthoniobacterales bacterium]